MISFQNDEKNQENHSFLYVFLSKSLKKPEKPFFFVGFWMISIRKPTKKNGFSIFLGLGDSSADGGARKVSEQILIRI